MPARTGQQYLSGLREQAAEVYISGERVTDVTTHPALRNGAATVASLYDMQHREPLRHEMTYTSPYVGRARGPLLHHPADPGRPATTPHHDGPLGAS